MACPDCETINDQENIPVGGNAAQWVKLHPCDGELLEQIAAGGGGGSTLDAERVGYIAIRAGTGYSLGDRLGKYFITDTSVPALVSVLCLNETTGVPIAVPPAVDLMDAVNPRYTVLANGWLPLDNVTAVGLAALLDEKSGSSLAVPPEAVGVSMQGEFGDNRTARYFIGATPDTTNGFVVTNRGIVTLGSIPTRGDNLGSVTDLAGFSSIMTSAGADDGFTVTIFGYIQT